MLNKETKQQAEQMRERLAPLFARASKLADVWAKKESERAAAERLARYWQYVGTGTEWAHADHLTEEQKQEAKESKKSPREWAQKLEALYFAEDQKEKEERAARYNFKNYLYYICEIIGEELKPLALIIRNQKGDTFHQFAEILNYRPDAPKDYHPHTLSVAIYKDCDFTNSFCLNVSIYARGACGFDAKSYRYYDKDREPREKKEVKAPKMMNAKQYTERMAKLKAYTKKAEELREEQHRKAKEWGMLDAVELLKYPQTEKAR